MNILAMCPKSVTVIVEPPWNIDRQGLFFFANLLSSFIYSVFYHADHELYNPSINFISEIEILSFSF